MMRLVDRAPVSTPCAARSHAREGPAFPSQSEPDARRRRLPASQGPMRMARRLGGLEFRQGAARLARPVAATAIPSWVNSGNQTLNFGNSFIAPPFSFHRALGPVVFNANHLLTIVVVVIGCSALFGFLRFTHIGIAVRASAERSDRASLLGVN